MARSTLTLSGTRYKIGGRVFYVNSFGQQFYGTIVGLFVGSASSRACLMVERPEWTAHGFGPECWHPDDYIRTRYWAPGKEKSA